MTTVLHSLLIESDDSVSALLAHHLTEAGYDVIIQRCASAADLQAALANPAWQVVIAHAQTRTLPPTAVLQMVHTLTPALPVIVIDDNPQVENAVSLLKAGASDYLPQNKLALLGTAVQQALAAAKTRDAQAQKRLYETAQYEKALSDSLIDSLPGVFYLFDEQGKFLRWNENFEKVSGYTAAEFSHLHPLDLFTGQDKILIQERIGAVFQTGKAEAELLTKDGRLIPYYFTGVRIQFNSTPCLIGLGVDISRRKQAEKSLLELKQAVDASGDAIFLTDREGLITAINAQFTRLYGYTAGEVIGKTTPRLLKSGEQDAAVYERFWQMITDGNLFRGEIINKTKNGRFVTIEETVNPFLDDAGNITGFLAIQRDVTAQKETERALQETRDFLEMALAQSP